MFPTSTPDSRVRGDDGIVAAVDAARLARALRGATLSRLTGRERQLLTSATTGGGPSGVDVSGTADGSSNAATNGPVLGLPPRSFEATNTTESVRIQVRCEALKDDARLLCHEAQVAVGLPTESLNDPAFRELLPHIKKLKPSPTLSGGGSGSTFAANALTHEEVQRLLMILDISKNGVPTLDLAGCIAPSAVSGGGEGGNAAGSDDDGGNGTVAAAATTTPGVRIPQEALVKAVAALEERYPLPQPRVKKAKGTGDNTAGADGDDYEEEEGEEEDKEALRHCAELTARCELLQIPYTTYPLALRDLALYEAEPFPALCRYLATDTRIKTVILAHNSIGGESKTGAAAATGGEGTVDLRSLRALAAMIDANESLRVMDLNHNTLGPNGIGIVCKALTKNICLQEMDLSDNALDAEALEEYEDPTHREEDPVFGERYAGLEAVSEVLKKNKFLRVLRLGRNGIHAGDDPHSPPEEDDGGIEQDGDGELEVAGPTDEDTIAGWEEVPLWRLVQPLRTFHRLLVLDLRGNHLGVLGARMLATALADNRSLTALDLSDNGIGYRGLHYLASLVLASPTSALHTLVLQRNELAGKSRNPTTQKKLRLQPKKAALAAMAAFAAALRGNRTMRRLVLSENHLGPVLSAALLSTVAQAEALEELDFSWNEACGDHESTLDLTAIHSIAAALYLTPAVYCNHDGSHAMPRRPTLSRLFLSGNGLCAAGLAALLPGGGGGFTPQLALRELDLSRSYIGDALGPLSDLLRLSLTLQKVSLAHNNISSLRALLPGLAVNKSLEVVDLSHNRLGSQEEQRHLPRDFGGATFSATTAASHPFVHTNNGINGTHTSDSNNAILAASAGDNEAWAAQRADVAAAWEALAAHRPLRDLNISWNDLRPEHAIDLMDAFEVRTGDDEEVGEGTTPTVTAALAKVDVSSNPKLTAALVRDMVAVFGRRPGMQVVYVSLPKPATTFLSTTSVSSPVEEREKAEAEAGAGILGAMAAAINGSASLEDVRCGGGLLRYGNGALAASADVGEAIEAMRRKLLVNAILSEVA